MSIERKVAHGQAWRSWLGAHCAVLALVAGLLAPIQARATGVLPNAKVGAAYSVDIDGDRSGYHGYQFYAVYDNNTNTVTNLPGLSIDPATGTIHGTPTGTGSYHIYYMLLDSTGEDWYDDRFITIVAPTLTLSPTTLAPAQIGVAYSRPFVASGGIAPYTLALGSGSSLPPGMTFSGNTLAGTPSQAGTFTFAIAITDSASGPGGPFSTSVNVALNVAKQAQAITFGAQQGRIFEAGASFALAPAATSNSGLPVAYASQTAQVCLISGVTVTIMAAGNCIIEASQPGNDVYAAAATVTRTIVIGKAAQAITGFAATPGAPTFAPNGTFTVSATPGASIAPLVFASASPAICSVSGSTVTMLAAGTCALTANQAGDVNYTAAPQATLDVAIAVAPQAIADFVASPGAPTFAPNGTFTVSATPGASTSALIFASNSPAICSVNGSTVTMLAAGTCTLTANQAGDANYTAAPQATLEVPITKALQTITGFAANPSAPVYAPGGTFTVSATPGASTSPVVFGSASPAVCMVSGNTVSMLAAGTCTLTADQAADANYGAASQATLNVVIGQAAQTITGFVANPSAPTFAPNGTFALSATGGASGNPVTFASTSPQVCTVSGATVTMVSAGTCSLTANQAGNDSYVAAPQVSLNVAIGQATQAITNFAANPSAPTFAPNGTFALSATGGGSTSPIVFASASPQVCTVIGSTVTMLSAGACSLTAEQAGDANYSAASKAMLQVDIAEAAPVLSWTAPMHKIVGEAVFELPAPGSTSPGSFTYASSDPAVATVEGRRVTIVGAGVTTLTATQAAAGSYAAGSVTTTLTVGARPDPTRDPDVVDGVQAQVDASVRFAAAQQDNIRGRLRQLREGDGRNPSSNNLALSVAGGQGPGLSLPLGLGNGVSGASLPNGWGLWTAGTIQLGERDANGAGQGFESSSAGVSFGFDRRFGKALLLGLAAGFGWGDTDFRDERSRLDADQRALSLYGLWRGGEHVYVDGLLGFGRLDFDIARWSEVAGATATARREGDQAFASLGLNYRQRGEHGSLTGYGRLDASRTTLQAYRETGLGAYDLAYGEQRIDSSSVALGVEGRRDYAWAGRRLRPYWLLERREALRNAADARINYVLRPLAGDYTLALHSYNDDAWALGFGLDMALATDWSLSLQYRRDAMRDADDNSFGLRLEYGSQAAPRP